MERIEKAEIAKMVVVFMFLILIPFISTSMRPSYLYFLLNVLIVVLALDSGILQSKPRELQENMNSVDAPPMVVASPLHLHASENKMPQKRLMKRCPSVPSLFFIGGCEDKDDVVNYNSTDEEDQDVWEDISELNQELFARAENFIGNFYTQLKIQREESWKKIHGLYNNKPM